MVSVPWLRVLHSSPVAPPLAYAVVAVRVIAPAG